MDSIGWQEGIVRLWLGFLLATLSPAMALADVAGTWAGVLKYPNGTLPIVLHISGPDSKLEATSDSPEQGNWGGPVTSISLSGPTLSFTMDPADARFSGDVMANGSIQGTFVQHGVGLPLVLTRSENLPRPVRSPDSEISNGRYHNDYSGVEFDLPTGFSTVRTGPYMSNAADGVVATIDVPLKDVTVSVGAWMNKRSIPKVNLQIYFDRLLPSRLAQRKSKYGDYTIPADTVQKLTIAGQPAMKATGYLKINGQQMAELLAWIFTTNTGVQFYALLPVDDVQDFAWRFDQMVQGATVP
jgi:hypothetical protein